MLNMISEIAWSRDCAAAIEIKSLRSDTHSIVLTASSDEEILNKFGEIGCKDFIIKPLIFNRLFAAIGKCIAELGQDHCHSPMRKECSSIKERNQHEAELIIN
jgi:DNA-binding NarL/FixJ family response regulator